MTIEDYEKYDSESLISLRFNPKFTEQYFGVHRLQQQFRIGYNRGARMFEQGVKSGVIVIDPENKWRGKLSV